MPGNKPLPNRLLFLSLLLCAFFIILSCALYIFFINHLLIQEIRDSLAAEAGRQASIIKDRLQAELDTLSALAGVEPLVDRNVPLEKKLEAVARETQRRNFIRIGISYRDGNSITTDNEKLYIGDREYFRSALNGHAVFSEILTCRIMGIPIIVHAVPIYNREKRVYAVLYATEALKNFASRLPYSRSNGNALMVVARNGGIISPKGIEDHENIFSTLEKDNSPVFLQRFRERLSGGKPFSGRCDFLGRPSVLGGAPVPGDAWNVIAIAPARTKLEKSDAVSRAAVIGTVVFSLISMGILGLFLRSRQRYLGERTSVDRAIESSGIYLAEVSEDGRLLHCNALLEQRANMDRQKLSELFAQSFFGKNRSNLHQALKAAEGFEQAVIKEDGSTLYIHWHMTHNTASKIYTFIGTDATERKLANKAMYTLAYYDHLSGLPNREYLLENLAQDLKNAEERAYGALFALDIDRFNFINNIFSHGFGDLVLTAVAERLKTLTGDSVFLAHLGGDDFILYQKGMRTRRDITDTIFTLIDFFNAPFVVDENSLQLDCSIGIAVFEADSGEKQADVILKQAEMALAKAKTFTGNSYFIFNAALNRHVSNQLAIERNLNEALAKKQFFLNFQPQYDPRTRKLTGFEALIRWRDSGGRLVSPAVFIPIAEETGRIIEIDSWVREEVFKFAKQVEDYDVVVSYNVSMRELVRIDFVDAVLKARERHGLRKNAVAIELTETCLEGSNSFIVDKISRFQRHGIQVHLDDFGTGYSSLSRLKNLPVSAIKIDKSFVDNITRDKAQYAILRTIIGLAREIDRTVIIEGIETEEQLECLRNEDSVIVQGYYFSPPVSAEEAIEKLKSQADAFQK